MAIHMENDSMKLEEAPNDVLVHAYITLRDQKAEVVKEKEAAEAALEAKMSQITGILLARFRENGDESVRTKYGTAFKTTKTSASVGDRDAYKGWILESPEERMVFLDMRCNKTAITTYRTEHENDVPPGVNWREELTIGIRRSS